MPVPLFLIIAAALLILPFALARGGHNGATIAGVLIVIIAIVITIATAPSRK